MRWSCRRPPLETWIMSQPCAFSARAKATDCARSQPPSIQSVADRRTLPGGPPGTRRGRPRTFERKAHPVLEASRHRRLAAVGQRREELVQEIAVGGVDLDEVGAGPRGPRGRLARRRRATRAAGRVERRGRAPAVEVGSAEGATVGQAASPGPTARRPARALRSSPCARRGRAGCPTAACRPRGRTRRARARTPPRCRRNRARCSRA